LPKTIRRTRTRPKCARAARRNDVTDRSRRILEELKNTGRDFEVEPDKNPGQIKAVLTDDLKINVRIMDARRTDMIGRVYHNGKSTYFQFADSGSGTSETTPVLLPEFVTFPLKYKLGESLPRYEFTGNDLSDANAYHVNPELPNIGVQAVTAGGTYRDVYRRADSYSATAVTAGNKINFAAAPGQQRAAYPDIRILTNGTRNSYGEAFKSAYEDGEIIKSKSEVAEEYLLKARNSAKANFTTALGIGIYDAERDLYHIPTVPYILDNVNKLDVQARQSPETDADFEYSDLPQAADMQKDYIKTRREIYAKGTPNDADLRDHDEGYVQRIEDLFGKIGDSTYLGSFNGVNIAAHMTSPHSFLTNESDLQNAFKLCEKEYGLLGDDFEARRFNDGTIKFESLTARDLPGKGTPGYDRLSDFWKNISDTTPYGIVRIRRRQYKSQSRCVRRHRI
jgi:hypothetical protein